MLAGEVGGCFLCVLGGASISLHVLDDQRPEEAAHIEQRFCANFL